MSASKVTARPRRIRFKADEAKAIARERGGATRQMDHAQFYGINEATWSRVIRGKSRPSDDFIGAVLESHPDYPEITFDALFEVVAA